jgi:hypothetical protein
MEIDVGARLMRAGLISLADLSTVGVGSGPVIASRLVENGFPEDALAGFFLAEGYGPLLSRDELRRADIDASGLSVDVLRRHAVVPLRKKASAWVVAMLVPSEKDLIRQLEAKLGLPIETRIAVFSDIHSALDGWHGSRGSSVQASRITDIQVARIEAPLAPMAPLADAPTRSEPPKSPAAFAEHTEAFALVTRKRPSVTVTPLPAPFVPAPSSNPGRRKKRDTWTDETIQASTHHLDAPSLAKKGDPTSSMRPRPRAVAGLRTFEALLGAMSNVGEPQEVLRLACRALANLGRSVVYFEVQSQSLVGRAAEGESITEDRIRRVALPADPGSIFRKPWAVGEPYQGACGPSAADAIYLSAIDGNGVRVHVEPVTVRDRIEGVFAIDDADGSPLGVARIEAVSVAVAEALERLGVRQKR